MATPQGLSFDRWLTTVRPHLPRALVDTAAGLWLADVARMVPAHCTGALEVRLSAGDPLVDLSVRLAHPDQARQMARRVAPPHLARFLAAWSRSDELRAAVPALWLELDQAANGRSGSAAAPAARTLLAPGICAQLAPGWRPGWLEDRLLPALQGRALSLAQRRTVRRCCDAVPAGVRLLYVFSMLSRRADSVRLELLALGAWPLAEYLARIAPQAAPELAALSPLGQGAERTHLSFDVGDAVLPRIGIEWSFRRPPRREPRWAQLFARLAGRGLCSEEKRQAVLAWPGGDTFWTAPREWPVETHGIGGSCRRVLSHVKVVHRPDREPEAKAYLLLSHRRSGNGGPQTAA
jgi:hypothetical protein